MSDHVLIVASDEPARASVEAARSLHFTPVLAADADEAVVLLAQRAFRLVLSEKRFSDAVRASVRKLSPSARLLELPDLLTGDTIRSLLSSYVSPLSERILLSLLQRGTVTRSEPDLLSGVAESLRESFDADRAWILQRHRSGSGQVLIQAAASAPQWQLDDDVASAFDSWIPEDGDGLDDVASFASMHAGTMENELHSRYGVQSRLHRGLHLRDGSRWVVGLDRCTRQDPWEESDREAFTAATTLVSLIVENARFAERAAMSEAKVKALLDQIPDAAAIYDHSGQLDKMNTQARRESDLFLTADAEGRDRELAHRYLDGRPLPPSELPSMLALLGETVRSDYLIHDSRTGESRTMNLRASPVRDEKGIIGSVVVARDVTDERQREEREQWRRRRAECLANLGLEFMTSQATVENLDEPARRISEAIEGHVRIYLYHSGTGLLHLAGFASPSPDAGWMHSYFAEHGYRPGEGLAGTVFQIGRPLLFYEIRGDAVLDYARDEEEKKIKRLMGEQSLIACPIEYDDRIGALVISRSEPGRSFDAEDLEFVQSVAERIGAASHIQRLTRMSIEGHRAAEELARQEVDARVRFEAVIETAPIGIAVVSADELRFELANVRWFEFASGFGRIAPDTKIIGLGVNEVIPDLEATLKQVAESGENRMDEALELRGTSGPMYVNRIISPVRGRFSGITQSITILIQDVTDQVLEDRANREREAWRRRRAECLANIALEGVTVQPSFEVLDEPAARIAQAISGTAIIYFYQPSTSELHVAGFASVAPSTEAFQRYRLHLASHPYHAGEGLAGTVFQIGRPLLFSDVRGNAVIDFGRHEEERRLIAELHEQSLIACPIESYGDRIGALVLSRSDARRDFDAEDLEFAQAVAERIGAASHIHRLTRMSLEGHRAAEELARREVDARVRFETVLETAPIGVAVVSADELRFELANLRWLDFASHFGRIAPDTKVIGLRASEVIPGFEQTLKQVAESGETRIDEAFEVAGRPSPIYVNRVISAVRGRFSGITQSITILIQDVTDQVKAQREIEALAQMMAERSARLDSILGSMTDGLWVYGADGQVVDVNQGALNMFGLGSRTEALEFGAAGNMELRYPDGRLVPSEDYPQARALRGESVPDYLAMGQNRINGRSVDLSVAAAPIESKGVLGAVLVMRDITALQELDRKKDEFLSVASHELRTPLTTIKGYTQLLAQTIDTLPSEERDTYMTAVLGEIDRMMGLISELLDVSRIESNRLTLHRLPVEWLDFVERRVAAFRVQHPNRTIRFEAIVDRTILKADPDRMRQVVDNLLSNAMKYSADGSEIAVRVACDGESVITAVIDHGIGIPQDEIPHLFDRFHRARNVSSRYYGGLGLGLYIARAIIEAHAGAVTVESREGEGSTFMIRLPLVAAEG